MDYQKILNVTIPIIKNAALILKKERNNKNFTTSNKGIRDYVTNVDIQIENQLKKDLFNIIDDAKFIAEESQNEYKDGLYWCIDPIDGTTNYIHGFKDYAISVALLSIKNGIIEPLIGIVCAPEHEELYVTYKGITSYKYKDIFNANHKVEIKTSETTELINSVGSFGFPYDVNKTKTIIDAVSNISIKTKDMKRIGPAALDICRVAEGVTDFYLELDLKTWDIAAAMLILKNAGGQMLGWDGNLLGIKQCNNVLATNGKLKNIL